MRVLLVLLVLWIGPALAGCLGSSEDEPRLATPTSEPPQLPARHDGSGADANAPRGNLPINTSDRGYVIRGNWSKGDSWYYETQATPYRYRWSEVMDVRTEGNRTTYVLEERQGTLGNKPLVSLRVIIDGDNWTRISAHNDQTTVTFTPPAANPRFLRNGTFQYQEEGRSTTGNAWRDRHVVNSIYAGNQNIDLSWGSVRAARIEHRDLVTGADGQERRVATIRWVNSDYLNDIAFEIDDKRYYLLIGARIGDREYGYIPSR